jgi:hypothetical protein
MAKLTITDPAMRHKIAKKKYERADEEAKMIHSVHVRDYGSDDGDDDHGAASEFSHPDFDKTVKAHGGEFHYHSDKGVAFKFPQAHHARAFAGEVNRKFKSLDADTPEHVHEEVKLDEGDPIVRRKAFPGEPPEGTYADMRRKGTLPKPVQAKDVKEEVEISEKVEVTIKKQTSDEPNVSQRHVTYDVYHNGKYHKTFKDVNAAMDHKEKMQEATDPAAPKRGRGRPPKPVDAEEASDTHPIMQLRKASSIGKPVTFKNGETHPVSKSDARKALAMHDALPNTIKKDEFANRLHQSHASFKSAVAGQAEAPPLDLMQKILAARAARKAGQ